MNPQAKLRNHVLCLENLMAKQKVFPCALKEAESLLVEEQQNLVPIYMDGGFMNFLEARIIAREDDKAMQAVEQKKAVNFIDDFRGNIRNIIYGMREYGLRGYPDLMVMTDDLASAEPAITNPEFRPFSFEIKPKDFELGLTGRLLEDSEGRRHSETLTIRMDIFDAYDFALSLEPKKVVAVNHDRKGITVYEDGKEVGQTEKMDVKREKTIYVMGEECQRNWPEKTKILPTDGLKVVHPTFYKRIKHYGDEAILFGHKFGNIEEFLAYATLTDNHIIWKICKSNLSDPNSPLVDAGPHYGEYEGKPRYENENRLHFMPHKASLWFDGIPIFFDKPRAIQALMSLGDIVRDIWIDANYFRRKKESSVKNWSYKDFGWDIIHDISRGITPEHPINVRNNEDFQKYFVLKSLNIK